MPMKKARLDHVAIRVENLEWYLEFFRDVFGMEITQARGADPTRPDEVWIGGFQLTRDTRYQPPRDGQAERAWHVAVDVPDLDTAARAMSTYPQVRLWDGKPEHQYWFLLPDGLIIELVNRA